MPIDLVQQLAEKGHVFVPANDTRTWLEAHGSVADWDALRDSWNGMPLDEYMADGGRYRRRRHAVYTVWRTGDARRETPQPHYQSRDHNRLNGDVARHFEPIPESLDAGPSLGAVLRACADTFGTATPTVTRWNVEVHQFRIEAAAGQAGQPTPEGVHRDGVDWVLVLLLRRDNIASGTTTIHAPEGALLGSFTLTDVGRRGVARRFSRLSRSDRGDSGRRRPRRVPRRARGHLPRDGTSRPIVCCLRAARGAEVRASPLEKSASTAISREQRASPVTLAKVPRMKPVSPFVRFLVVSLVPCGVLAASLAALCGPLACGSTDRGTFDEDAASSGGASGNVIGTGSSGTISSGGLVGPARSDRLQRRGEARVRPLG